MIFPMILFPGTASALQNTCYSWSGYLPYAFPATQANLTSIQLDINTANSQLTASVAYIYPGIQGAFSCLPTGYIESDGTITTDISDPCYSELMPDIFQGSNISSLDFAEGWIGFVIESGELELMPRSQCETAFVLLDQLNDKTTTTTSDPSVTTSTASTTSKAGSSPIEIGTLFLLSIIYIIVLAS